jgi:DNA-binding NtrC family response regulator
VLGSDRRPPALAADGCLDGELAARLERLVVEVPPLRERREDLPALALLLLARFAAEQELLAPRLEDAALAALWRQPWDGNLRELGNVLFRLALEAPGAEVGGAQVEGLLARSAPGPLRRLPSRHPPAELVRAALRTTRTLRGTLNKTRAALYLGWDPDTLVARMRDLGLPDGPEACAPTPAPAALERESEAEAEAEAEGAEQKK